MLFTGYAFVAGFLIGSFLNTCIYRFPIGQTVVTGRSMCMTCGHTIAWYDLIPVASFLLLRGKCRNCKAKISPRYPFVELLNALLYLATFLVLGVSIHAVLVCLMISALIVAAFIDHDTQTVPDRISLFIALVALAGLFVMPVPPVWERLAGVLVISIPMLLLACLTGGFGGADIKLSAACGLLLGYKAMLLAAMLAAVSAAVVAVLLIASKKATRKTPIAFVPFLAAGFVISALFSNGIIRWYLSFF